MIVPFTLPLVSFSESVVATNPFSSPTIFATCIADESNESTSKAISPLRMIFRLSGSAAGVTVVVTVGAVAHALRASAATTDDQRPIPRSLPASGAPAARDTLAPAGAR